VPIYNILTKLYNIGIHGNYFQFLKNLYLTSKAGASLNGCLSEEFPINRGVRQGCPLSPILFNIFINDILDNCRRYGVIVERKKCCGGLFADDIVLIALGKKSLRKSLNKVHEWAIKPLHFKNQDGYVDPTFHLGFNPIPKTTQYTYLGIPFNESLSLQPIISNLNSKLNLTLNSYFRFLTNRLIPLHLKKTYINLSKYRLGFLWILRIRCGLKFNSIIARRSKLVSDNCPCCKEDTSIQSFTHWIFSCKILYTKGINATLINEQKSLNLSLDSEKDDEDNVKFFVLNFGERRKMVDHVLLGPTVSSPPYMLGLAAFLTCVIPEISRSFKRLFDEYSTGPTVVKSVDVETIRQGRIFPSDTDLITTVNRPVIIDEWEKLDNIASSSLI